MFFFQQLKVVESPETKLKDYHETWASRSMNWLYPTGKELNKEFLEPIPTEMRTHYSKSGRHFHLDDVSYYYSYLIFRFCQMNPKIISILFSFLQIMRLLQDCDVRFQLLLTGLHHILNSHENQFNDMELEKYLPLHKYISDIKNNTRMVLCEIRTALKKLGAPFPVIIDTKNTSKEDNENTTFYEWIVFREYLNQLEHLHEVVEVIIQNIDLSSLNNDNHLKSMSG